MLRDHVFSIFGVFSVFGVFGDFIAYIGRNLFGTFRIEIFDRRRIRERVVQVGKSFRGFFDIRKHIFIAEPVNDLPQTICSVFVLEMLEQRRMLFD